MTSIHDESGKRRAHTFTTNWHKRDSTRGRLPAEYISEYSHSWTGDHENGALNMTFIRDKDGVKMHIMLSHEDTAKLRDWLNRMEQEMCKYCNLRAVMPGIKMCETCRSS